MTGPAVRTGGSVLDVLRRIATERPAVTEGERCEMCAQPIAASHPHLVDLDSRGLMCACRGCYLLFTAPGATLRYRAVPDRYLSFPGFSLGPGQWDRLEIPVGLAFFFHNSKLDRMVAFYPGPAGATESDLPLGTWDEIVHANPELAVLAPDVEALLVRMPDRHTGAGGVSAVIDCHLVPIDSCYELVGRLRRTWRGFDGGQEARREIDEFFVAISARSRPAPGPPAVGP